MNVPLNDENTSESKLRTVVATVYTGVKALAGPTLWGYSLVDLVADTHVGLSTDYIRKGVESAKQLGLLPGYQDDNT